jgi:hypothetical protein
MRSVHHPISPISLLAIVAMAGCNGDAPTRPTQQAVRPQPASTRTITGSVWLHSPTAAPLAGVRVEIWLELPRAAHPAGSVTSNAAGRFSFDAPSDALVRLYTHGKDLFQPCLSTVKVGHTEATIRLVTAAHLLEARGWPDFAVERLLSGTIFEASPTGRVPSPDAWVQVDGAMGDGRPLADTRADANGRFVVCGLEGETQILHALVVFKPGFQIAYANVPAQGGGPLDVEFRACPADRPRLEGGWCH